MLALSASAWLAAKSVCDYGANKGEQSLHDRRSQPANRPVPLPISFAMRIAVTQRKEIHLSG